MGRRSGTGTGYHGRCTICGWEGLFSRSEERTTVHRDFRCGHCSFGLRFRDEAHVLIDEFGDGRQLTLDELVRTPAFRALSVYYIGYVGPVRGRLSKLETFVESGFDPDLELGSSLGSGRVNQDVQRLTFDDQSFDLVMSSHVMEHVPDPWLGFAEIARVLRPGGRAIFSIPAPFPLEGTSVARAELEDGEVVHHAEARYHASPEGEPSLVFTDFGADLVTRLDDLGLDARVRRPHLQIQHAVRNVVVVGCRRGRQKV